MKQEMIVNACVPENTRVAIVSSGRLEAYFEEFHQDFRTRGNIYLGEVINVQPGLDACFVDYGESRHGFLPMGEILPRFWKKRTDRPRIEHAVTRGQKLIVQIDKEPSGTKGARLSTHVSLAGRYMVLMPYSAETRGVSRRIEDPEQRQTYREIADKIHPPKGMGVIVRTAGLGMNKRDLSQDLNYLIRLWKDIDQRSRSSSKPCLLHADADLVPRILRDYYSDEIEWIRIDDAVALQKAEQFFRLYMPRKRRQLKAYTHREPIFSHFGIEQQIEELQKRRVQLPSGGSLVIDQTEALVAIDVNSGKIRGQSSQGSTAYKTNQEAAIEIARQLRLRDLGGIVVIDFIDMSSSTHRREVERILRDAMKVDKARNKVGKISTFGLCTLTRQRLGKSLLISGHRPCPTCGGDGVIRAPEAMALHLLRQIREGTASGKVDSVRLSVSCETSNSFQNQHRADLLATERESGIRIEVLSVPELGPTESRIELVPRSSSPSSDAERPAKPVSEQAAKPPAESSQPAQATDVEPAARKRRRKRRKKTTPQPAGGEQEEPKTSQPKTSKRRKRKKRSSSATEENKGQS
ncbi:MAG: Rne/Rng family ribonuclease [Deltaproteobacteria bacterium]|nr:Rne/Rng family ribonuclease [Deltaproteobacteria bacterium]